MQTRTPEGPRTSVVGVDPLTDPRWDAFVRRHRDGGAYHLGAWAEIFRRAYGYRPCYLALEAPDRTLVGAMPVMRTRGLVTGRRMRSLPVVPPAGPLVEFDEDMRMLIAAGCRRAERDGAKVWTLHSRQGGLEQVVPELRPMPKHPTYVVPLGDDAEELRRGWKKSASNLFRSIKKAEKAGVTVREARGESDLRAFYALYARTMRRRRVLPRPYAQLLCAPRMLPEDVFRLFLAEHGGRIVAGALWHSFGSTLDLLYNGSDERAFNLRPNHALYWDAIRWATERGKTELDLGQARPGSGLADFKAQWGAEPVPEYRYDYVPGGGERPAPAPGEGAEGATGMRAARLLQGRESRNPLAAAVERAPVRALSAAARVAYRL